MQRSEWVINLQIKVIHAAQDVLMPCNVLWLCIAAEDCEHDRPKSSVTAVGLEGFVSCLPLLCI